MKTWHVNVSISLRMAINMDQNYVNYEQLPSPSVDVETRMKTKEQEGEKLITSIALKL